MKKVINIAIVEDHDELRKSMIDVFLHFENIKVLFGAANGQILLDELKTHQPEVIMLDINMPVMDGTEALRRMQIEYPEIKVIMFSSHFEQGFILAFIKEGASAYLSKNARVEVIIEAIEAVAERGFYHDNIADIIARDKLYSA